MTTSYSVQGKWPFPSDMLRYDMSVAETERDQRLIDQLSSPELPSDDALSGEQVINLKIEMPGEGRPHAARWASFGWTVISPQVDDITEGEMLARRQQLLQQGLAKLTPEEREAFEWFYPPFQG